MAQPSHLQRWFRHFATEERAVRRCFGADGLRTVETEITAGERRHRGQVRFAVEAALPLARVVRRVTPRERALEVFALTRTWDTEENCGVLVYLLLADRDVEIVADRGIHRAVGEATWEAICRTMEAAFRERRFVEGTLAGISAINDVLATHFPRHTGTPGPNELPDKPLVL